MPIDNSVPPLITLNRSLYATHYSPKAGHFPPHTVSVLDTPVVSPGPIANTTISSISSRSSHTNNSGSMCSCSSCERSIQRRRVPLQRPTNGPNAQQRADNTSCTASSCSSSSNTCSCSSCNRSGTGSSCSCSSCPYHNISNADTFYGGRSGKEGAADPYMPLNRINVSEAGPSLKPTLAANVSQALSAFEELLQEAIDGGQPHLQSMGRGLGMGSPMVEGEVPTVPDLLFPYNGATLNASIISDSRNISVIAGDGKEVVPRYSDLPVAKRIAANQLQEEGALASTVTTSMIDALVKRLKEEGLLRPDSGPSVDETKTAEQATAPLSVPPSTSEAGTALSASFLAAFDDVQCMATAKATEELRAQHHSQLSEAQAALTAASAECEELRSLVSEVEAAKAKVASLEAGIIEATEEITQLRVTAMNDRSIFESQIAEGTANLHALRLSGIEGLEVTERSMIVHLCLQDWSLLSKLSSAITEEEHSRVVIEGQERASLSKLLCWYYDVDRATHEDSFAKANDAASVATEQPTAALAATSQIPNQSIPAPLDAQPPASPTVNHPSLTAEALNESFSSGYDTEGSDKAIGGGDRYGISQPAKALPTSTEKQEDKPAVTHQTSVPGLPLAEDGLVGTPNKSGHDSSNATDASRLATGLHTSTTDASAIIIAQAPSADTSSSSSLALTSDPFEDLRRAIDEAVIAISTFPNASPLPHSPSLEGPSLDPTLDALFLTLRERAYFKRIAEVGQSSISDVTAMVLTALRHCSSAEARATRDTHTKTVHTAKLHALIEEETRTRYSYIASNESAEFLELVWQERVRFGALLAVIEAGKGAVALSAAQRRIGGLESQLAATEKDLAAAINSRTKLMQLLMDTKSGLVHQQERPVLAPVTVSNIPIHERFARAHQEAARVVAMQHYPHEL